MIDKKHFIQQGLDINIPFHSKLYCFIFSIFLHITFVYIYYSECHTRTHEARCKNRLTQSDFAAQLQVRGIIIERDSISRIEIGTRFVADYELMVLTDILKVSVDWLLGCEK